MVEEGNTRKPNDEVLLDNIGKIAYTLDRAYMPRLESDYGVLYFDEKYNQDGVLSYSSNVRAIKVDKWLFDREQEPGECFKNVLSTFADGDHTIALVVKRTPTNTEMYFVVKNEGKGREEESRDNVELLNAAIRGNFPGSHTEIIKDANLLETLFDNNKTVEVDGKTVNQVNSVALFANSPSEYSEKYITQGLDKLLNGIVPETEKDSYTVVFMAESISQNDTREIISGYEDIASAINPFAQYQFQMGTNEVETTGEMSSITNGTSTTNSVFKTHSINIGVNGGLNKSHTDSEISDKIGATKVASIGGSFGYGYSWGSSKAITNSTANTEGKSHSLSVGKNESTTYTYKSFMVTNLLDRLEKTIERVNQSQATGLWKYSTYVL